MLGTVVEFFEQEKTNFSFPAAVATAFGNLKMIVKEIKLNSLVVQEGTKGKVVSKDDSQEQIIRTTLVFAGAIYGYAATKNDTELLTFADINSRTILKLRDSEVPAFAEKILDKVDELGAELISFGIDETKRTLARTKLADYEEKFASLGSGRTTKKAAAENIPMLFNKADKLLKVLDKLLLGVKDDNPELFSRYTAARSIYDKRAAHNVDEPVVEELAATTTANS